jgi:hypothetical protein
VGSALIQDSVKERSWIRAGYLILISESESEWNRATAYKVSSI